MFLLLIASVLASGLGTPGAAVPLYALQSPCDDPRYPALAGPWLVGCGPDGQVDRALSLRTNRLIPLPVPSTSPALGEGWVYVPGFPGGGAMHLTEGGAILQEEAALLHDPLVSPPTLSGERLVALSASHIHIAELRSPIHKRYEARPVGWYPPALGGDRVAWVDRGTSPCAPTESWEEIWWMPVMGGGMAERLSGAAGHARHVVGAGGTLAWVEEDGLVVLHVQSGMLRRIPDRTGFSAAPTVWGGEVCWESLSAGGDVDIRCTDASLSVQRPGHQRWPSRWGPWLVFREGDTPWLMTQPTAPP